MLLLNKKRLSKLVGGTGDHHCQDEKVECLGEQVYVNGSKSLDSEIDEDGDKGREVKVEAEGWEGRCWVRKVEV